jgi:hypothetical protein
METWFENNFIHTGFTAFLSTTQISLKIVEMMMMMMMMEAEQKLKYTNITN